MSARRRSDRTAGQSLVEFALVIPVFFLLLFGVIDVGRFVYVNNAISEGAREGARWGSVERRSATAGARATIASHASASMAAVPDATISVTCETPQGVQKASCATNDVLVVSVSTSVSMFTPVIGGIVGTRTITAVSKVAVNQ